MPRRKVPGNDYVNATINPNELPNDLEEQVLPDVDDQPMLSLIHISEPTRPY